MDNTVLVIVVTALATLLVAGFAWFLWTRQRSKKLKEQFGPEYQRTISETGDRSEAEKRLQERRKRVEEYDLRPLDPEEQVHFRKRWDEVQTRFVDDPRAAIADAQRLVDEVMEARGYPVGDIRRQQEDVSVEGPAVVTHYRKAREIAVRSDAGEASTEDLRVATKHYRSLFSTLLEGGARAKERQEDESEVQVG